MIFGMKKIMLQQYMGVLATLATLILSITLYAYKSDTAKTNEKINTEIIERKGADLVLVEEIKTTMSEHEKIHQETRAQFNQIQTDLKIIKEYLINK